MLTEKVESHVPSDFEITPGLINYTFGQKGLLHVQISNVTTTTLTIPLRAIICELQRVSVDMTYRISKPDEKNRGEFPQKLTQLSPRIHPRDLVGKRIAQTEPIKYINSDSQVNSFFPYRWSPTSLTFNSYFYLFLYLHITRITINNGTPHRKSPKHQNKRAAYVSFRQSHNRNRWPIRKRKEKHF